MIVGEKITNPILGITYTVLQSMKAGGQAETAFAKSNKSDKIFFIKRLLNIKYSDTNAARCQSFEEQRNEIYKKINEYTLPGGACSFIHDFFRERSFYYVVTEKIDGVELKPKALAKTMPIEDRLFLFRIIVYSLLPFEENGIIHSDIKPENILLKQLDSHFVTKLIDFESSFFVSSPPEKGWIVGTEPYYSPELAAYNNENNTVAASTLTTKSDIFSLGVILYELLTGHYPVSKGKKEYVYELVAREEPLLLPSEWSSGLKSLVSKMLNGNASSRPGILDILKRLKSLVDVSTPTEELICPTILIKRDSNEQSTVTLLSFNKSVEIYFSLDNGPSQKYETPFIIDDDDILLSMKVLVKSYMGELKSAIFTDYISVSENRYKRVPRPVIRVVSGLVTIECLLYPDATLHYTLDGSAPSKSSSIYISPFRVEEHITIKAIARHRGMISSEIVSLNSSSKIKIS